MTYSFNFTRRLTGGTQAITEAISNDCEVTAELNRDIANPETDLLVNFTLDVSQLKSFAMVSNFALTVKTNSSGAPQETFNLVAGVPVFFNDGDPAIFAGDVTALYVTNASGSTATLRITAGLTG